MTKTFAAAKSMYNSTDQLRYGKDKALAGMVGGQARKQDVLTPEWLLDAVRAVAPIVLDPCTIPSNPVGAEQFCYLPEEATRLQEQLRTAEDKAEKAMLRKQLKPYLTGGGLSLDWSFVVGKGVVFVNPPFDSLEMWMRKCELQATTLGTPSYLLCPFRPHRKWFSKYAQGFDVITLAPFAFRGHSQAFPAPLCLICYGAPAPVLGKRATGVWRLQP